MAMHKGMCGRTESNGPASTPVEEKTLGDYLVKKYPEVMTKKKMTFDEWWLVFSQRYSLDDCDSLKCDFEQCWEAGQQNV